MINVLCYVIQFIDQKTCATSKGSVRWWQVQIKQSWVHSIAITLPHLSHQHFSIFIIQLLDGNQAMYKPRSAFNSNSTEQTVLFECNGENGLLGEFVYIRDERPEEDKEFKLCEVQIISQQGNPSMSNYNSNCHSNLGHFYTNHNFSSESHYDDISAYYCR